ncbi:MAG: SDR family oxidoreductase [Cyclobacteriaceae bacterium]
MNSFKNHKVIISGALGDIGKSIVMEFVKMGAHVAMGDIKSISEANDFLEEVKSINSKAKVIYYQVDVRFPVEVKNWIDQATIDLGILDIIIPNAATVTLKGIMEVGPLEWSEELKVNIDGAFYLSKYAAEKLLKDQVPGRVVFIGSWAADVVHPNLPVYCISKAALRMLSKCMALELAKNNILVNEVAPGYVDAGLSKKVFERNSTAKDDAINKVPVRRIISPEEVAKSVIWLSDFKNNHMTGSTLLMDGGLSLLT